MSIQDLWGGGRDLRLSDVLQESHKGLGYKALRFIPTWWLLSLHRGDQAREKELPFPAEQSAQLVWLCKQRWCLGS